MVGATESAVAVAEPFVVAAALAAMSVLAESEATAVLAVEAIAVLAAEAIAEETAVVADRKLAEIGYSCLENKQAAVETLIADPPIAGNLAASRPVEDTMAGSKPAVDKLTVNRLEKGMMNVNSYSLNCVNLRMNRPNVHGTPRQRFLRTWQKMH